MDKDMEKLVNDYHAKLLEMKNSSNLDFVTPLFERMRSPSWWYGTFADEGLLLPRCTVALIAIIGIVASTMDFVISTEVSPHIPNGEWLKSAKVVLFALFCLASGLLLIATILESVYLVQLYIWYTPGFVILGLVVAMLEFACKNAQGTDLRAGYLFMIEVAFLFTIFRCMPLIYRYFRNISTSV